MTKATIIGAGSVGITLALKLQENNDCDFELIYRSAESKVKAIESGLEADKLYLFSNEAFDSNFIIIAVGDNDIPSVVRQLSELKSINLLDKIVFHTSGAQTKKSLDELTSRGCTIAAAHPYQTFYNQNAEVLYGIAWGVEAEGETFNELAKFIALLDGKAIKLSKKTIENKSLYHISAVAASNFMALTIELAKQISEKAGIDAGEFMPSILRTTLQNNIHQLNEKSPAITGPIVRGDVITLEKHIIDLGESVSGVIYRNISESLALMAFEQKLITGAKFEQIMDILDK